MCVDDFFGWPPDACGRIGRVELCIELVACPDETLEDIQEGEKPSTPFMLVTSGGPRGVSGAFSDCELDERRRDSGRWATVEIEAKPSKCSISSFFTLAR
jgi:hypothetical protein